MTRVYNGFPLDAFPPQASSDLADVDTSRKKSTTKKNSKNSKRSRDESKANDASSASSTTTTSTQLALAPEDASLKAQLSDKGFYHVTFEEWKEQPEGAHTCYTVPQDYLTPLNGERKRVYAVLEKHIENGRTCNGYKSDRAPWDRVNYPTVRFYLKQATAKRQHL
jgi:hypothetical protein